MTPTDWQETTLTDIAYINPIEKLPQGTVAKKIAMDLLSPFTKKITGFALEKYKGGMKFRNGDTLIARITPCLENGKTAYVDLLEEDEVGFGSTEFIVLREKSEKSCKQFLYYFAISPDFRDVAMLSMTGSSGRQRVQSKVVEEHLFSFPPLPEQRAIADVLSSLDDKIDLLDRQNQTLEALAETLFRQWFIEEANPDWEEGTLGELAEVQNGYSFKSSEFSNESDGFEVLKMGHIDKSGGLKSVPKRHYMLKESRLFKYVLQKNDIVMCMTDMKDNVVILGVPAMVDKSDHYVLNQRVARISLRKGSKILSQHILYLFLKDPIFIAELQKKANSGVQVNLTTDAIKNSLILIPPLEKQIKVVSFLDSIYSKFDLNKLQIRKLERLRDALLPKLMAGSVRVGNLSPTLSLKGEGAEEETKNPLPLGRGQGEGIL